MSARSSGPRPDEISLPVASRIPIGWMELASLPRLKLYKIKAKIDTGARTSALHVVSMAPVNGDPDRLDIVIRLKRGDPAGDVRATVRVIERVMVRDSGGHEELRPVIRTALKLGDVRLVVRLTLTDRGEMICPMLVGRTALGGLFTVLPEARFLLKRRKKQKRFEEAAEG